MNLCRTSSQSVICRRCLSAIVLRYDFHLVCHLTWRPIAEGREGRIQIRLMVATELS